MSIIDLLTDDDVIAAGKGIAALCLVLAEHDIDPRPYLTERQWLAMQALACPIGMPCLPLPGLVVGAPDDDFAIQAAGGN